MTSQLGGKSFDIPKVSRSLPALLSAYAVVLEQVGNEPLIHIHRRPGSSSNPGSSSGPRRLVCSTLGRLVSFVLFPLRQMRVWWWGFAIRPIVRLFVETHINAKTAEIGRFLRQRRLRMAGESSDDTRLLDEHLRLLGHAEGMVSGWSRWLVPLRFVPGVAMALSWALVASSDLPRQVLYLILTISPLLMLVVYPVVVRFGFRWKRAFFVAWPSHPGLAVDLTQPREASTTLNIYELENQVYSDMGLRKHSEIPIDVILHPAPYWLLTVLVSIVIPLAFAQSRGGFTTADWMLSSLVQFALVVLFLLPTLRVVRRYRRRRDAGLV